MTTIELLNNVRNDIIKASNKPDGDWESITSFNKDDNHNYIQVFRRHFCISGPFAFKGHYDIGIRVKNDNIITCYGTIKGFKNIPKQNVNDFIIKFNDYWEKIKNQPLTITIEVDEKIRTTREFAFSLKMARENLSWKNNKTNSLKNERPTIYAELTDKKWDNWQSNPNAPEIKALAECCVKLREWADYFIDKVLK